MVFVPYMGLSVNIYLEIVSSKMATTHNFQSGVRNCPARVSWHEIEVSTCRRESWQVYKSFNTGITEVTGSNPVEALHASSFQLLKLEN